VGNGTTTVNVGDRNNVQAIRGSLYIQNTVAGQGTVDINDSADPNTTAAQVTLDQYQDLGTGLLYESITNLSLAAPIYVEDSVSSLTVHGDNAGNTFFVRATAPLPGGTMIYAGAGGDTFNVGSTSNTFDPIQGGLTVYGAGSSATLDIHDDGTSTPQNWDIADSSIDRFPAGGTPPSVPQVTYSNMATVTVNTGTGKSAIRVEGTATLTKTNVNANGGGPDQIVVESFQNTLDDIQGPLHVHDVAPSNLFVLDGLNSVGHTYTLSTGLVQRDGIQPITITYDNMAQLVLATANNPFSGHAPGNTVNVWSLGPLFVPILVGTGDTVTIGQNHSMTMIQGDVRIQGQAGQAPKQVTLDDQADPNPTARTVTLRSDATFGYLVSGLASNSPTSGRIGLLLDPNTPVSILSGPAVDLFQIHDLAGAPALSLVGHPQGTTTLQGPNTANTWQVSGTNAGTLDGTVAFSNVQNLIGGSAGNAFQFHTGGSVTGSINGGGGTNTLDYSAYQWDILVDLLLNTASLVGQGVFNMANVTGSQGNSLIVGDANTTALTGGTGRNVLIGGGGTETITGGGGFNLLIGGKTVYDTNLAALQALQVYWDNPNATTLDQLVNPLKKGVTVNGQFLVLNKTTVQDDNAVDKLIGGRGPNWFIKDKEDTINNGSGPGPNDRLLVI
jgi:hypothetical protein